MTKYIDASKLKAEIERLKSTNPSEYNYQNAEGYTWALDDLLSFIDTLSEEPDKSLEEEYKDYVENDPVYSKLVNRIAGLSVARHFAQWGAEHLRDTTKMIDKSLEEAANNYLDGVYGKIPHSDYHIAIFIAGAKWKEGQFEKNRLAACEKQTKEEYDREMEFAVSIIEKEHRQPTFSDAINYGIEWQKKQIPMPEDTVLFNKGVAEGKRLMLEEAIEGEVYKYDKFSYVKEKNSNSLTELLTKFNDGDTVRIIVLPKED